MIFSSVLSVVCLFLFVFCIIGRWLFFLFFSLFRFSISSLLLFLMLTLLFYMLTDEYLTPRISLPFLSFFLKFFLVRRRMAYSSLFFLCFCPYSVCFWFSFIMYYSCFLCYLFVIVFYCFLFHLVKVLALFSVDFFTYCLSLNSDLMCSFVLYLLRLLFCFNRLTCFIYAVLTCSFFCSFLLCYLICSTSFLLC